MEQGTKKLNPTRLFITLGIVLITALAIGGSTYYVMISNTDKMKEANDKQTAEMQKQIDDLKKNQENKADAATTATKDETADWKSYSNNDYGVSFKYPSNLTLTDKTAEVRSAGTNNKEYLLILESAADTTKGYRFSFTITSRTLQRYNDLIGLTIPGLKSSTTTINGYNANVYTGSGSAEGETEVKDYKEVMFFRNQRTNSFVFAENSPAKNLETFNKIVNTVKFN